VVLPLSGISSSRGSPSPTPLSPSNRKVSNQSSPSDTGNKLAKNDSSFGKDKDEEEDEDPELSKLMNRLSSEQAAEERNEPGDDDAELDALLAQLQAQADGQFFNELNATSSAQGAPQFDIDVAVAKIFEESFEGDFQKCEKCKYPITGDDYVEALGKVWHPYHLQCGICSKSCGGKLEEFREADKIIYCANCYLDKYGPRCNVCNKLVVDGYMQLEGATYCQKHYHEKNGYFMCSLL